MGDLSAHFSRSEFACRCGCGFDTVDVQLLEALEGAREHFDASIKINRGATCKEHNAQIEGASPKSQHLVGKAADIVVEGVDPDDVADYFERIYPNSHGIGRYHGRTHIDVRSQRARWDLRKSE